MASTKSSYSPNWRVQNLFGEYDIEVTRQFGEYEFFLMSNPVISCKIGICVMINIENATDLGQSEYSWLVTPLGGGL